MAPTTSALSPTDAPLTPGTSAEGSMVPTLHGTHTSSTRRTGSTRYGPFELRWTETGPFDGPVTLLLHGIYAGAHGYEWRELVPLLDGSMPGAGAPHRVRVADLLGAGGSDRPDLEYDPAVVLGAVRALIGDCGPDCTVIASSLTGAYATKAIADSIRPGDTPADTPRLVLVTPTGLGDAQRRRGGLVARAAYAVGRHTPIGDLAVAALTSGPSVRWFQRNKTYSNPEALHEDEVVETRRAGRLPNGKHLQLAFVTGRLALPLSRADVRAARPLVVWARGQAFSEDSDMALWQAAGATVVAVPSGLPQVEEPGRLADLIRTRA